MKVVIEQSELQKERLTYQEEIPLTIKCRTCKHPATLFMQVHDEDKELLPQRPKRVKVWPHDSSVTNVYLCTNCGAMRASWNQG